MLDKALLSSTDVTQGRPQAVIGVDRLPRMVSDRRRRRAARRLREGDGRELPPYRFWQLLDRSLFHIRLPTDGGGHELWSVDIRHMGDANGEVWAGFYRDRLQVARAEPPALMPVPGGVLDVATSSYGLKRCHFVPEVGAERPLLPDHASAAGMRARLGQRFPVLSRFIGALSILVLLIALVIGAPQLLEQITTIPPVAERVGTFTAPVHLPLDLNVALVVATLLASTERALRLRYHWLLDGGLFDGGE